MELSIAALISALAAAERFEEAAAAVLRPILALAAEALVTVDRGARVLRAMAHVRPDGDYRGLALIEDHDGPSSKPKPELWCAPSTTSWRWVTEHGEPLAVDVTLGIVTRARGVGEPVAVVEDGYIDHQDSLRRLLVRAVTHLLVLPLRAPGGGIKGMISIEVAHRQSIGRAIAWGAAVDEAQTLADAAAPYLLALPSSPSQTDDLLPVIGRSMAGVVDVLRVFARQEETVLLSGPTGAGKSRLARWSHEQSRRRGKAFETIDLATVPEELQMAELFGWKKGAFSGAIRDTAGCIARAEGGTLFIDEVDKLSLKAQAGLLRMLEERRYKPLGEGSGDGVADVRFVVGTNASLPKLVQGGGFREDLYYRIHVLPVRVPPLAERSDEIARWASYMLKRRHRDSIPNGDAKLTPDAEEKLARYPWPGNLRQLDNIVRRAYALALISRDAVPEVVEITGEHVTRALDLESGGDAKPADRLLHLLDQAAATFVKLAKESAHNKLDLDLADGFRGIVLTAAIAETGGADEAFRLLDKESMVQNRNHWKALRREIERANALCRALGLPPLFKEGDERS